MSIRSSPPLGARPDSRGSDRAHVRWQDGRIRSALRQFERDVLGAPAVPPGRVAAWATSLRRRLLGAHRRTAPPPLQVLESLFAAFDSHALRALVELGVPDALTVPLTTAELARRIDVDPQRLDRLLGFAAGRGFVALDRRGRYRPNGVTSALRSDAAAPWQAWVRFATSDWFDAAWRQLGPSVRGGSETAFELAHGVDFFEHTTSIDPAAGDTFDRAMAAGATLQGIALAHSLDWADIRSVCDVGGGSGATLDALQRYEPHLETTLFDLPAVVDRSRVDDPAEPSRRCVIGGSFFDEVPPNHDRYLLSAVVHDWDDASATTILTNVCDAMGAHADAVVVETVASDRPRDDFAAASDLLMFVLATGRERTGSQYRDLFDGAGLVIDRRHLLPTGATAFVLRRVGATGHVQTPEDSGP